MIHTSYSPAIYVGGLPTSLETSPDTATKILSFEELEYGWHYGEGGPPDSAAVALALKIYWTIQSLGFEKTDAFPGAYGEIMVTGYQGEHYVELIAERDGTVSFQHEINDDESFSGEHMEANLALEALAEAAGGIWSTSDFSIQSISTQGRIGSRALLSETTRSEALPLFRGYASIPEGEQYVHMREYTIYPTLPGNPQFFGNLTTRSSLLDVAWNKVLATRATRVITT